MPKLDFVIFQKFLTSLSIIYYFDNFLKRVAIVSLLRMLWQLHFVNITLVECSQERGFDYEIFIYSNSILVYFISDSYSSGLETVAFIYSIIYSFSCEVEIAFTRSRSIIVSEHIGREGAAAVGEATLCVFMSETVIGLNWQSGSWHRQHWVRKQSKFCQKVRIFQRSHLNHSWIALWQSCSVPKWKTLAFQDWYLSILMN